MKPYLIKGIMVSIELSPPTLGLLCETSRSWCVYDVCVLELTDLL